MHYVLRFRTRMCRAVSTTPTTRNKEGEEDVVMGTNEAYEAVAMRYQQPASALQGNLQEEPVYELAIAS